MRNTTREGDTPNRGSDKKPRGENTTNNKSKTTGSTLKAGFVMSIIAIALCWVPAIGLVLSLIAIGLMLPEIIKAIKIKKLPIEGSGKFIAGCIMSVITVVIGLIITISVFGPKPSSIPKEKPQFEQEYSSLKKLDLNGVIVSEACAKLREAGWRVRGVGNGYMGEKSEESDCSDTVHKVSTVNYSDKKYSDYDGSENHDYESVFIEFVSNNTSSSSSSTESSNNSTSSSSNTSSSNNTSSSSSNSMCKDDYQKDLDAAKASYEYNEQIYNTYKNMSGVDADTVKSYKDALDISKASLDTAQKLYDTYCK
ncbi:hypothetical protein IKF02_00110 [Candidatus Saccharibacteria bacterium]|nr:hypothetical protein [Candidatus Saccharibacteria bacterium]